MSELSAEMLEQLRPSVQRMARVAVGNTLEAAREGKTLVVSKSSGTANLTETIFVLVRLALEEMAVVAAAELKARGWTPPTDEPPMRYGGIWREGSRYKRGSVCTHASTSWYAHVETTARPGINADWQMMSKPPRDTRPHSRDRKRGEDAA